VGDIGPEVQHYEVLPAAQIVVPSEPAPVPESEQVAEPPAAD
jgi:hypothetical protein